MAILKRWCYRGWLLFAALCVLSALLLSGARLFAPLFAFYKPEVEKWASQFVGQQVSFERVGASWSGFEPAVHFENVQLSHGTNAKPFLQARVVDVGVDLWHSLWHQKFEAGLIRLSGIRLALVAHQQQGWMLQGVPLAKPAGQSDASPSQLFARLGQHSQISLKDVAFSYQSLDKRVWPLHISQLVLKNSHDAHHLVACAQLGREHRSEFYFIADAKTSEKPTTPPLLKFYIRGKHLQLKDSLSVLPIIHNPGETGQLDAQVWGQWDGEKALTLKSRFDLNAAHIPLANANASVNTWFHIDHLSGNMMWRRQGDKQWQLTTDQLNLQINGHRWPTAQFEMTRDNQQMRYAANYIALQDLLPLTSHLTVVPKLWRERMRLLQPQGIVQDLILKNERTKKRSTWSGQAQLEKMSWHAWQDFPGVTGLAGTVKFAPEAGALQLQDTNLSVNLPKYFVAPLLADHVNGQIRWQRQSNGWQIQVPQLDATREKIKAQAQARLQLFNQRNRPPYLWMTMRATGGLVSQVQAYLPEHIMKPDLVRWLHRALQKGNILESNLLMRGPLQDFPVERSRGVFAASAKIKNSEIEFDKDWPGLKDVKGEVHFLNRQMTATIASASLLSVPIKDIHLVIPRMQKKGRVYLDLSGHSERTLQEASKIIYNTPLKKTLGEKLDALKAEGPMKLDLQVHLPLGKPKRKPSIKGKLVVNNAVLRVPEAKLKFHDLKTKLSFTEKTVTASHIEGRFLANPIKGSLYTQRDAVGGRIRVSLKGEASINVLRKQFGFSIFDYATGSAPYQAVLSIPDAPKPRMTLNISSQLVGAAVNLPAPLKKLKLSAKPLKVTLKFGSNRPLYVNANYENKLKAALVFKPNAQKVLQMSGGEIHLGAGQPKWRYPTKLLVSGHAPYVNAIEWYDFFKQAQQASAKGDHPPWHAWVKDIDVKIDKFDLLGQHLGKSRVRMQPVPDSWRVSLDNTNIAGTFTLPERSQKPWALRFKRIYIPESNGKNVTAKVDASLLPPLDVMVQRFIYGKRDLGMLYVKTVPTLHGLTLEHVRFDAPAFHLSAKGAWQQGAGEKTQLNGTIRSQDLIATLKRLNLNPSVKSHDARLDFNVAWADVPYAPSLSSIVGTAQVRLQRGEVIQLSDDAKAKIGLGRILTLFSLQSIPRRLRLDFSDLTDDGFSFDVMEGNFKLKNGNASTQDSYIDGTVARVDMRGRIGLVQEDYDVNLVIKPYVTSSLPVLATIAGGPVAGAVTWAVEKLVTHEVQAITAYSYRMTGSWHAPKVQALGKRKEQVSVLKSKPTKKRRKHGR